ncbi:hypothetical protein HGB24_03350 [Candidatus Saccharibacteria bacterium]|nr:hypothetical protein [Candidatus Saccharibacteria bacterium]
MVREKGLGHDKIHSEFFATPPRSVTFVIRAPALRTSTGRSHLHALRGEGSESDTYQLKMTTFRLSFLAGTPDSSCNSKTGNNTNAGKNYNRVSQTIDSVSTWYCYDMADRLIGSSNNYLDSPTYDSHGNTLSLGSGTGNVTSFAYDQSDRNVSIEQGSSLKTTYTRDAQDGIVKREVLSGGTTSTYYYGYTGGSNYTFMYTNNTTKQVIEKYLTLPGGVVITLRPTESTNALKSNVTLRNFSGHALSVLNGDGVNQTGVMLYDAFGQKIGATTAFASANPSVSFASSTTTGGNQQGGQSSGWASSVKRSNEDIFTLKPIQMGSRVYIPSLGRFLSVDPVEGGSPNNYAYTQDPVNQSDYSGQAIFILAVPWAVQFLVGAVAIVVVSTTTLIAARSLAESRQSSGTSSSGSQATSGSQAATGGTAPSNGNDNNHRRDN